MRSLSSDGPWRGQTQVVAAPPVGAGYAWEARSRQPPPRGVPMSGKDNLHVEDITCSAIAEPSSASRYGPPGIP